MTRWLNRIEDGRVPFRAEMKAWEPALTGMGGALVAQNHALRELPR